MEENELLLALLNCKTEREWCNILFALGRNLGFDQVLFGIVANKRSALESAYIRSNYSSQWRNIYDTEMLHYIDPTITHCYSSNLPLIWAPHIFSTPPQKQLYEEACSYNLRSGVSFPIHGANGEFGLVCFASDARADKRFFSEVSHFLANLALIRDYAFESSSRFATPTSANQDVLPITPREKECLKWTIIGKTSWEISQILRCSEATVNFHIANIRRKFGVRTRQQAVIRAVSLGLIPPF